MPGSKIVALKLVWKIYKTTASFFKTLPIFLLASVFLLLESACVMTKAQGEQLGYQVRNLEDEVAKFQRIGHDMEVLLVGKIGDMIDRIGRLERHLSTLRESLSKDALSKEALLTELKNLRGELEETQVKHQQLEFDQRSLVEGQMALAQAQQKVRIPPFKEEHFSLAKKYYLAGDFEEAMVLLKNFIEKYPGQKELNGQSHYLLGEINRKLGDGAKAKDQAHRYYKRSVLSYQKIVEMFNRSVLREEALFKIGSVLKTMGNIDGAKAAFKELLFKNKNSNRAPAAKNHLADLEKIKR